MSNLFNYLPLASFTRGVKLITVAGIIGHGIVLSNKLVLILTDFIPTVTRIFGSLPRTILNNYAVVVFNGVVLSNFRVVTRTNFARHGVAVTTLSLAVNVNFARIDSVFARFPTLFRRVFTSGYVTITFIITIVLGAILPDRRRFLSTPGRTPTTSTR